MKLAIAGGTGAVGAHVVRLAEAHGHTVQILARSHGVDLNTGQGVDLTGVDAVIDVSGTKTTSAAKSRGFFEASTGNLLCAGRAAGVKHHLALSIVGAAGAPYGYYAGKAAQEQALMESGMPYTILRATQFFEFAEQNALRFGPWVLLPKMRSQPVAARAVAAELVRLAEGEPTGAAFDAAGPQQLSIADVARAIFEARGERRRVAELSVPGGFGRALRDGSILPGTDALVLGPTLTEWVGEN